MKKIFATLASVVLTASIFAQAPQKMSYQAVVRDINDKLVPNQVVGMQISILKDSPTEGKVVYTETQTVETNANGLVSINIGGQEGFEVIDWANGKYYFKTEIDLKGGTNYTITGTYQILSVPYALHAVTAELTGDQTIDGNKTFTGTITVQAPVNAADAATKAYVDALIERIELLEGNKFKDYDGNDYATLRIGNQLWMVENLKTTHFNDGTDIPLVTDAHTWAGLITPGYCWYNNEVSYKNTYGALYNWLAVETGKLCPRGWQIPTMTDWNVLEDYLIINGYNYDGSIHLPESSTLIHKLAKALASSSGWTLSSTIGAIGNTDYPEKRNATGFTALPGGYRMTTGGTFSSIGSVGGWWSSIYDYIDAWVIWLSYDSNTEEISHDIVKEGHSVRCVRNY